MKNLFKQKPLKINLYFSIVLLLLALIYMLYPAYHRVEGSIFLIFYLPSFALWWLILPKIIYIGNFFIILLGASSMLFFILFLILLLNKKRGTEKFFNRIYVTFYIGEFAFIASLIYFGFLNKGAQGGEFKNGPVGGAEFIVISLIMAAVFIAQVIHYIFIRINNKKAAAQL